MMALSVLQEHGAVVPLIAGGHSLGEYSALCAAGVMDFEQALETVRVRAEAMDRAQPPGTSGMAAVMGCVQEDVLRVVEEQRGDDVLEAANFNAPDQVVVSGRLSAVNRVLEAAKGLKRARAVMLPVSSAFHTVLMDSARDALSKRLNEIDIRQPRFRVAANVNGEEYASPDAAKDLLLEQLVRPVRWDACVRKMREAGAELFLEIGPGKVLTGLLKRIDKNAKGVAISSFEDIQRFVGETQ
jgi:[acyl-carrier-protein] S-malonyltransferase